MSSSLNPKDLVKKVIEEAHVPNYVFPTMEDNAYMMITLAIRVLKSNVFDLVLFNNFSDENEKTLIASGVKMLNGSKTIDSFIDEIVKTAEKEVGKKFEIDALTRNQITMRFQPSVLQHTKKDDLAKETAKGISKQGTMKPIKENTELVEDHLHTREDKISFIVRNQDWIPEDSEAFDWNASHAKPLEDFFTTEDGNSVDTYYNMVEKAMKQNGVNPHEEAVVIEDDKLGNYTESRVDPRFMSLSETNKLFVLRVMGQTKMSFDGVVTKKNVDDVVTILKKVFNDQTPEKKIKISQILVALDPAGNKPYKYDRTQSLLNGTIRENFDVFFENTSFVIQNFPIQYNKEEKEFTAFASELGLPAQYWNSQVKSPRERKITLTNGTTDSSKDFEFSHTEAMDGDKDEVGAWVYKNNESGIEFTIFND